MQTKMVNQVFHRESFIFYGCKIFLQKGISRKKVSEENFLPFITLSGPLQVACAIL